MSEHTWRELERADMDTAAAHAAEMEHHSELDSGRMSEYIVELDSKRSIALGLAFVEEMRGGDFVRGEIVRCRDCKHYDPNDEPSEVYPDRYWCDRLTVYMPPDGFCSFGKRKVVVE